jgi:stage V sporulation protein B
LNLRLSGFLANFRNVGFSNNILISIFGGAVSRAITLASMALISRLYPAESYGAWIIVLSLATFIMPLATLRYDLAMVLAPSKRMSAAIAVAIVFQSSLFAFFTLVGVLFFSEQNISAISGLSEHNQSLLIFVPVMIVLMATSVCLQAWSNRERNFLGLSISQITQSIATAVLTLLLPLKFGATPMVAATAASLGMFMAVLMLIAQAWPTLSVSLKGASIMRASWHGIRKYRIYALLGVPYALSIVFSERLLQLIITNYFSLATLASYFVARQVIMGPTMIVANGIRTVIFSYGARLDNIDMTRSRVLGILTVLIGFVAPALAFSLVWIETVATYVMGSDWPDLPQFAYWTMFPACMLVLTGWIDRILDILKKQKIALWLQLSSDFSIVMIASFLAYTGFHAIVVIAMISLAVSFYNIIWLYVSLWLLRTTWRDMTHIFLQFCIPFSVSAAAQELIYYFFDGSRSNMLSFLFCIVSFIPAVLRLIRVRRYGFA